MTCHTTTNVTVDMYADDSTITATGKSIQSVKQSLTNDLQEISNWCDENRTVINAKKTKIMITTTRQKWRYLDTNDPDVWIEGDQLQVAESGKLLGFKIANVLTWKPHVQNVHRTHLPNKEIPSISNKESTIITAIYYHTWITAAQSGAMHRHQSVSSNYRNVLPESPQTLNTEQKVPHS